MMEMLLQWRADFSAEWSITMVKGPSSKYCGSFVKAHTNAAVSSSVAQYLVSAPVKLLERKRIGLSTPSEPIWF
jgi:hypothetical protein